jgi:hypothetical protein
MNACSECEALLFKDTHVPEMLRLGCSCVDATIRHQTILPKRREALAAASNAPLWIRNCPL